MKRLTFLVVFLCVVSFSYAANKMSMVTYFPVPYVAYSQVSADQQLDVGLTSTCNMTLGCRESDVNLKAHTVNLQKGKLELNNGKGVFGQSISLGNGNGSGQVRFNNVRMKGGEMQSLNADGMNVRSLELFGKPFPACKGKGGSDGQMKWQKLALQGYSGTNTDGELYLVCGGPKAEEKPKCCDSDFTGDFAQCIKDAYGISSAEYICASGTASYVGGIGSVYGVYSCGVALNIGSDDSLLKKYGDVWFNGGFRRYACDGRPSYSGSSGDNEKHNYTWQLTNTYCRTEKPQGCQYSPGNSNSNWDIKNYQDCTNYMGASFFCDDEKYDKPKQGDSCEDHEQSRACWQRTNTTYCESSNTFYTVYQSLKCQLKE